MVNSSTSTYHQLIFVLLVSSTLVPYALSADPDPLQDFCVANLTGTPSLNGFPCKPVSETVSADFFFDGLAKEGNTSLSRFGTSVTRGNVLSFPGLNTLGISMNRVDLAPGGFNPPHSHPRATEIGVVIQGRVPVGFVTTGNVFHSKILTAGEMFVIPRGLAHFQMNVGEGKSLTFTAFNSHLAGTVMFPVTLFGSNPPIPNQVLTQAYQVGDDVINNMSQSLVVDGVLFLGYFNSHCIIK